MSATTKPGDASRRQPQSGSSQAFSKTGQSSPRATQTDGRPAARRPKPYDRPRFLRVLTGAALVYLFAPIVIVILFSFNGVRSLSVINGLSLEWYKTAFTDPGIRASVIASLEIAVAVMLAATFIGTLLALGLQFARKRISAFPETILLFILVVPEIATAIAALLLFTSIGFSLGLRTVIIAQITWSIGFVTIIVKSGLASLDPQLEEAAMDLGATRAQSMRLVILPQLWPAIAASSLLIFVFSWDDFVTSYFATGIGVSPLPVRIYAMIKYGISPAINAVGTSMLVVTLLVALLGVWVFTRQSAAGRRSMKARKEARKST